MSCPNFETMRYNMPLVVGGINCIDEYETQEQMITADEISRDFSAGLQFYRVGFHSGYYYGFQFLVVEKYGNGMIFDLDKDSPYCIDNEEAHYYFGMCRSKVLRKAEAERKKIAKWLRKIAESGYGFEEWVCTAVFSNGEAVYNLASNVLSA